jgi:prepilin-type N-terminal cleavage/methylation domain-containing protein
MRAAVPKLSRLTASRRRLPCAITVAFGLPLNDSSACAAVWRKSSRRGSTLIELLIVVTVIVVLLAVAIPAVKYALEDQKVREAARQLNAYLASAQARAAELGRPVGVWLERDPRVAGQSIQLFMARAPQPYGGDLLNARVSVDGLGGFGTVGTAMFDAGAISLSALVKAGDYIRFDFKGPLYEILTVTPGPPAQVTFRHLSAPPPPSSASSGRTLRYQILRQPVRSTVASMEMPVQTVVDLTLSGMGASGRQFVPSATSQRVIIMFNPGGGVEQVYWNATGTPATGTIHLFVGRAGKVNNTNIFAPDANLADQTNLWVSINHRTGTVTSTENAGIVPPTILDARKFALTGDSKGGR